MSKKEQVDAVMEVVENAKKKASGRKAKSPAAKAAEKAATAVINDIAAAMPHGKGKEFLEVTKEIDQIEDKMAMLGKQKRGCRARLKELKVDLEPYDHVRKLRKKEPEDMQSFEASVALYKEQLGMPLSGHQQVLKKQLEAQREAARDAMIDANGGTSTGKEIGSRQYGASTDPEIVNNGAKAVPEKNDNFSAGPIPPVSALAH